MKKLTLISHFYNEEYLLPWWLNHHKALFDHAILINYHSTDRSVEIIKEICPTWEVRPSRNPLFDARQVDAEVMDIEREISGYKICLNTTEFLIPNETFKDSLPTDGEYCLSVLRATMVDVNPDELVLPGEKLTAKKDYGFWQEQFGNCRFLHNYPDGSYHAGRHVTNRPILRRTEDAVIYWYGFAPWTEEFVQRKLQIKNMIPQSDKDLGMGHQHLWSREKMEEMRLELLQFTKKLS